MVSVIIPNYNHASFLIKRIDSVLNQTYRDFELIILDDCSTDNSVEIIESYSDNKKISHIIYNKENSGSTFKQWKKGLDLAKGDFIWIAESDDWADITLLENLVKNIKQDTSIAFCYSKRFWKDGDIAMQSDKNTKPQEYQGLDFISKYMLLQNTIENASMAIFAKDKVDFTWFDNISKLKYCGDWLFWIKLAEKGNVMVCPKILNYFRQNSVKVTNRAKKEGLDFIEGVKILFYIRDNLKINISKSVIAHWSNIWIKNRIYFEKGVLTQTLKSLASFSSLFLVYIPYYMIVKRIKTFLR